MFPRVYVSSTQYQLFVNHYLPAFDHFIDSYNVISFEAIML
jgi:hypothetical protein